MVTVVSMTMATKTEVLKEALPEYLVGSRAQKKEVLDRLEKTLKMHRKSLVRRLRQLQLRKDGYNWHDGRGRPTTYTPDITDALRYLWDISHELCAERLHASRGEYLGPLIRDGMWPFGDIVTGKLRAMSIGTMKERVSHFDRVVSGGGRSMTKPSSLKEIIPVRRGPWKNPDVGCEEMDTVAHCGQVLEGLFAYSVQTTDIALSWCFLEAQLGKDGKETTAALERMRQRSPYRLLWLDPDSGSEFINWVAKGWADTHEITLTRIRPGEKNDHGHIEQKNNQNVRKWAGYIRIDTQQKLQELKDLYAVLEIYINHFQPSMHCVEKIRYNITHSSRKYDKPQTPFQRFMTHPSISKEAKEKMRAFHETLNPKVLHDELLKLRKRLFRNAKFTRSDV